MQKRYFFLYHHEISKEAAQAVAETIDERFACSVEMHIFKKQKTGFFPGDTVFVMADDPGFAVWLSRNAASGSTVIIIPFEKNPIACRAYGIPSDPEKALELAAAETACKTKHLLLCNGEVVLERVQIGRTDWHGGTTLMAYMKAFFKGLLTLRLQPVHIETAKAQQTDTAMLLIDAGSEMSMTRRHPHLFRARDNQCGRVAMLVYAPQSILAMLRLRLPSIGKNGSDDNVIIPDGAGTLKSETIRVQSPAGKLRVTLDGKSADDQSVTLESAEVPTTVVCGFEGCLPSDDKESIKLQNLPKDEETITHISSKTLPLIPVASETAFAELFTVLREEADAARWYIVLLIISTLLAATGLFQNSSPTVIGAMILSPLMAPVVVLAMGMIRFDRRLISASAKTLLLSVVLALASSALFAYATPLTHLTAQMGSRMNPNLLDLAVAIFSGIAAAYGYAHTRIAKSLAGVAVAVALVPPLSVAGIGLGWGSWPMFSGASLLFLANIAGIVAAAGVTFYLMGFSSWRYAKTALVLKLLMLSAVAAPLYLSTRDLIDKQAFYSRFDSIKVLHAGSATATLDLERISMEGGKITANIIITAPHDLSEAQKQQLIRTLRERLGTQPRLTVMFRYEYE